MMGWIPMGTVGGQLQRWQVVMRQGNMANRYSANFFLSVPVLGLQKTTNEKDLPLAKYFTSKKINLI